MTAHEENASQPCPECGVTFDIHDHTDEGQACSFRTQLNRVDEWHEGDGSAVDPWRV